MKINTFGGTFCGAPHVLCKIEKSKNYNFTVNYMKRVEIITRNLRIPNDGR